ncbi:hypothetical protein J3T92_07765 [Bifidobacterium sp. B4081]|uniref:hypothetical protein n=1 Tax=Bifidobacterium sp. B3998 TaxID=2817963 RepID=UPI00226BAEEB|nr:hypothetical protein [Bifidobacterium sp. B3998]MCX8646500.1 hypothetical protein [Bifidobacterium sp. B4081]
MIVAIVTNLGTILVLIWFMLRVDRLLREHPSHQTDDKSEDDSWHSWRFWNPPSSDDNEDELDAENLVADDDMSFRSTDRYASSTQEELGESSSRGSNKSEESSRDE